MTDTHYIFLHGWGYDALFWDSYIAQPPPNFPLKGRNNQVLRYDRGYFGTYHKPSLGVGKNICVTHSTGLFFADLEYDLHAFDEIIIYAGFERFENKASAKAMRLGLKKNATQILLDFYNTCGFTPNRVINPNIQMLGEDLKMLETYALSMPLHTIPYRAYHGTHDIIVPKSLKGAMIIPNAGHLCNLI